MRGPRTRIEQLLIAVAVLTAGYIAPAEAQRSNDAFRTIAVDAQMRTSPNRSGLSQEVTLQVKNVPLSSALRALVRSGVPLVYSTDMLANVRDVRCDCEKVTLREALQQLTSGTHVEYRELDTGAVLVHLVPRTEPVVGSVRGRVVSMETNQPVQDARVSVVGLTLATSTDAEGRYVLTGVPDGPQRVEVEVLGYRTADQRVTVSDGSVSVLDFTLATQPLTMNPLQVTASTGSLMPTETKKIGHSIEIITEEEIEESGARDVGELLRGRVAGVVSTPTGGQNGAGMEIQIRGATSFFQDQTPLVYVDGVPVDAGSGALSRLGLPGSYNDQATLHARLQELTVGQIERIEVVKGPAATTMYGTDAVNGVIQIFTKRGVPGESRLVVDVQEGFSMLDDRNAVAPGSQYEEDLRSLFKNPRTHSYSAAMTGGSADLTYSFGLTHDGDDGVVVGNDANTTTLRTSLRAAPLNNLTIQLSGSFVNRGVNSRNYRQLFQNLDLQTTEQTYSFTNVEDALRDGLRTETDVNRYYAGATIAYEPVPGWSNRVTVGLDNSLEVNETVGIGIPSFGYSRDRTQRTFNRRTLNAVSSVAYPRTGFLTSTFSVGVEGHSDDMERLRMTGTGFPSRDVIDFDEAEDLRGGSSITIPSDLSSKAVAFGAFAQEMIGFGQRAYLTLGVRADGNSAFGDDYGMQVYPKVSASYIVNPMRGWDTKLRAAWGQSGKAPDPYAKDLTLRIQGNLSGEPIEQLNGPGNVDLKPELGSEWEVGMDHYFGVGRSLSMTYFRQTTRNALLTGPIPLSTGFATGPMTNIGELRSSGVEMSVNMGVRLASETRMRVGLTMMHMIENGLVVSLGDAFDYLNAGNQTNAWGYLQGVAEGESIRNLSYGSPFNRSLEDPFGDYVVAGSRVPVTTGGLTFSLDHRQQFNLTTSMVYGLGGKAFDNVMAQRDSRLGFTNMCCWYAPVVAENRYIYRTDFAKLSLARLTYALPSWLIDRIARDGEVYVEGHNLISWDLFPRGDPEANSSNSHTQGAVGTFTYLMPMPQRYGMGLKLTLGGGR